MFSWTNAYHRAGRAEPVRRRVGLKAGQVEEEAIVQVTRELKPERVRAAPGRSKQPEQRGKPEGGP